MSRTGWMQITDYSNKYRVSVSTLRRRIKANEIEHVFEDGKYWLPDAPTDRYARKTLAAPAPAQASIATSPSRETSRLWESNESAEEWTEDDEQEAVPQAHRPAARVAPSESDALTVAREMVKEMKSAYVLILQEKEEQILQLKEEITDLRTLCRILESDNERLKNEVTKVSSVTSWLDEEPSSGLDL